MDDRQTEEVQHGQTQGCDIKTILTYRWVMTHCQFNLAVRIVIQRVCFRVQVPLAIILKICVFISLVMLTFCIIFWHSRIYLSELTIIFTVYRFTVESLVHQCHRGCHKTCLRLTTSLWDMRYIRHTCTVLLLCTCTRDMTTIMEIFKQFHCL